MVFIYLVSCVPARGGDPHHCVGDRGTISKRGNQRHWAVACGEQWFWGRGPGQIRWGRDVRGEGVVEGRRSQDPKKERLGYEKERLFKDRCGAQIIREGGPQCRVGAPHLCPGVGATRPDRELGKQPDKGELCNAGSAWTVASGISQSPLPALNSRPPPPPSLPTSSPPIRKRGGRL